MMVGVLVLEVSFELTRLIIVAQNSYKSDSFIVGTVSTSDLQ
jgi:hypothetical protein